MEEDLRGRLGLNTIPSKTDWDNYIEGLKEDFSVEVLPHEIVEMAEDASMIAEPEEIRLRMHIYLVARNLHKERSLLLANNKNLLLAGKGLGLAVLPCEIPGKINDFEGFPMVLQGFLEAENSFLDRAYLRDLELPWEILETEHLLVREETEGDIDAIYEMYEDQDYTRYIENPYPEKEDELSYMRKYRIYVYEYYGYGLWFLIDKATGKPAGRAGLSPKTYSDDVVGVELGYLIHRDFARRGYCMEVCKAILEYGRTELELSEVYCLIRPENEVSLHIAEKLGFFFEKEIEENGRLMHRFKYIYS